MDAVHRRIELQAPEDLTYLIDNVRRAAADSINAAFPPVDDPLDGQEDELRDRIEQLVNDYIRTTFTLALPNLTINGLPVTDPAPFLSVLSPPPPTTTDPTASDPQQQQRQRSQLLQNHHHPHPQVQYEYEPFDPRKRDRIEQLVSEEEDLLRSIAQLKRRAPGAAARRWAEASQRGVEADESARQAACERLLLLHGAGAAGDGTGSGSGSGGSGGGGGGPSGADAGGRALEGMGALDRQAEVEARFRDGVVRVLARLSREMPAAVAKMERARVAAGYVAGSSSSSRGS